MKTIKVPQYQHWYIEDNQLCYDVSTMPKDKWAEENLDEGAYYQHTEQLPDIELPDNPELRKLLGIKDEVKKPWRAEEDGVYYYVNTCESIGCDDEEQDEVDDYRHLTCNYFKTKQQAYAYKEHLEAVGKLRHKAYELNGGIVDPFEVKDWASIYCSKTNEKYAAMHLSHTVDQEILFKTEKLARQAINELGNEVLDKVFKYKRGE